MYISNEKDGFKSQITIIIPTYNRYGKLQRLLKYYESYKISVNIKILDSSINKRKSNELEKILGNNFIEYVEYSSDIYPSEKVYDGLKSVSTKYTVFCADDDFITPKGLEESIDFLEGNKDYVVAHGRYIIFNLCEGNPEKIEWKSLYGDSSIESNNCGNRLLVHLGNYKTPSFYGVHRTDILKMVLKSAFNYTDDYRFGELLPTAMTSVYGKIKVLNVLYSAREYSASSNGKSSSQLSDFIVEGSFDKKYERFKKCLAGTLYEKSDLSYGESEKLVDRAMNGYLKKKFGSSINILKYKCMFKKIFVWEHLNKMGLLAAYYNLKRNFIKTHRNSKDLFGIPYGDPTNQYYAEFCRINEMILNYKTP